MKYLIMLAITAVFSSCTPTTEAVNKQRTDPPITEPVVEPTLPTAEPTQPLNGVYSGEMTGKLIGESKYKITIALQETPDGKFTDNGKGTGGPNYYQLWDLNQPARENNLPHYDGYATGQRDGSVLNLALPINYKNCSLNLKGYVSTDSKTLEFFSTKQTVNCGISVNIVLKSFAMNQK